LLHLVGSSILLYLIDDARTNTNQVYFVEVDAMLAYVHTHLFVYHCRSKHSCVTAHTRVHARCSSVVEIFCSTRNT